MAGISEAMEAGKRRAKELAQAPTRDALRAEIPCAVIKDEGGGKWSARIEDQTPDKRWLRRWQQMNAGMDRLKIEHGAEVNARRPTTMLKDPKTGRVMGFPSEKADVAGRKRGLVPYWRPGGLQVRSDASGMLWRRVGQKWEPVGRCSLGTPLRKCGNEECEACK